MESTGLLDGLARRRIWSDSMQSVARPASTRTVPVDGSAAVARPLRQRLASHPDLLLSLGLFGLALLPRLLYLLWAPVFIGGDSLQYFQPVYDLMTSGKFTLTLKRP